MNKESVPSRAYIAFKNEEMLATFSREYDGHIFKDKAGAWFPPLPVDRPRCDGVQATNRRQSLNMRRSRRYLPSARRSMQGIIPSTRVCYIHPYI